MNFNVHWSQQHTTQLYNYKPTTNSDRRTTRPSNLKYFYFTKDLMWQKQNWDSKQSTRIHCPLHYKSTELMLTLYKSIVLPHLEYLVQFWSSHLRRDIDKIEKIQIKARKMLPEIRSHGYQQRLKDLEFISLARRRLRGQLVGVFKYLNRFNNVTPIKRSLWLRLNEKD